MLIPATYQVALLLMIVSAFCWGSWAITQKLAGAKWRFELYYADFSFGILLGAVVLAFTAGSFQGNEITFLDSLIGVSLRKVAWALLAGFVFNLSGAILVSAISVAGLSVAVPIALSIATMAGIFINVVAAPQLNSTMTWVGLVVLLLAVVFNARAYLLMADIRRSQQVAADPSTVAPTQVSARSSRVRKSGKTKTSSSKGIVLAIFAGILLGGVLPLLELSRESDIGLSPYAAVVFFASGLFFTSLLIVPFLMNFPVEGEPLEFRRYTTGTLGQHILGWLGGMILVGGLAARVLADAVPKTQGVGPAITLACAHGAALLAAILGVLFFKEFENGGSRVRMQLVVMFVLLALALALTSLAPLY
jgi:glucose uptake protein